VFAVTADVPAPVADVWGRLTDWAGHADWVPATTVTLHPGPCEEFTAATGVGRWRFADRMRVVSVTFDGTAGRATIAKLGPVLFGTVTITAVATGPGSTTVMWSDDLAVARYLPRFAAPVAARLSAAGFRWSLRRFARTVARPGS
jgi:carbon monoxide dehydrogenase subunit G